jgi:hypothetical protein
MSICFIFFILSVSGTLELRFALQVCTDIFGIEMRSEVRDHKDDHDQQEENLDGIINEKVDSVVHPARQTEYIDGQMVDCFFPHGLSLCVNKNSVAEFLQYIKIC